MEYGWLGYTVFIRKMWNYYSGEILILVGQEGVQWGGGALT